MPYVLPFLALLFVAEPSDPEQTANEIILRESSKSVPVCESGHAQALSNGVLTIKPGETICVLLHVQGKSVVAKTVVESSSRESTLVVKFWREPAAGEWFLELYNPLGGYLRYQAAMVSPDASKNGHTSTCPVLSRRRGFEYWNYPITQLALSDFEQVSETNSMTCG